MWGAGADPGRPGYKALPCAAPFFLPLLGLTSLMDLLDTSVQGQKAPPRKGLQAVSLESANDVITLPAPHYF